MAGENKITYRVQAAKASLNKMFDKTAGGGRNRTGSVGPHAHSFIDRARNAVSNAFRR